MAKNSAPSNNMATTLERVLERCLTAIETNSSGDRRLFFPDGIELIRINGSASNTGPNFDFEITIAGPAATKPLTSTIDY